MRQDGSLEDIERLGGWLDDRFRIPGTRFRVGLDGLLGLVPGVGDAATGLLGAYIVGRVWQAGVPKHVLLRMGGNVLLDTLLGSIPLVGDLFDFGFKANRRNIDLLLRHRRPQPPAPRSTA